MRLDGSDFFCTTTFPVGKDYCSLVVGGWGGAVVGLSNVDYADASENATTKTMGFKDNQWYRVRIRVSDAAIEAWIDGQQDGRPAPQGPQVRHPHGGRSVPSAGHFHLVHHGRGAQHPRSRAEARGDSRRSEGETKADADRRALVLATVACLDLRGQASFRSSNMPTQEWSGQPLAAS